MKAQTLDARRRLTMPAELDPLAAVTLEQLDRDTWLVRRLPRARPPSSIVVKPLTPAQARRAFRRDKEWEAVEAAAAQSQVFPRPDA